LPKKINKPSKEAESHIELEGFDIKIDPFGQMESSYSIEKLNDFLDKKVKDRKLNSKEEE
jgi:hypothetical protein